MKVQNSIRLAHTSSVLISVVLNAVLVFALLTFIKFSSGSERETTTVMVIDPVAQEDIEELPDEIKPEEPVDPDKMKDLGDFSPDTPVDTKFEQETETVDTSTATDVTKLSELMSDISSPVVMTNLLKGRTPRARKAAMARYGNGLEKFSEPAVMKALVWLRDHQQPNGSWNQAGTNGGGSNVGYTGLALLAFLAHGETPASVDFGAAVAKGIRYIVEHQDSLGVFRPAGSNTTYGHAIATYALSEAYTMTDNILLREPLERGVKIIEQGMMPNGGFDYGYKHEDRNDLSTSAWQVQSLKAAAIALHDEPEVKEYFHKAMDGMMFGSKELADGSRSFAYTVNNAGDVGGGRKIISAAGTLGQYLAGRAKSKETRQSLKYIEKYTDTDLLPRWGNMDVAKEHGEIMFWYYAVQAFFQEDPDGKNFRRYMPAMVKALAQNQETDGHWDDYTEVGKGLGPVLNTSLASLGLMVYYRYLPTTQASNIQQASAAPTGPVNTESDGDVGFEL